MPESQVIRATCGLPRPASLRASFVKLDDNNNDDDPSIDIDRNQNAKNDDRHGGGTSDAVVEGTDDRIIRRKEANQVMDSAS